MIEFTPKFSPRSRYMLRDQAECDYFESRDGAPEAPLIDWALQFCKPEQSFIDVGAHVGTWAQHFAQHCAGVVAFEPQPDTNQRLKLGIEKAGLSNIIVSKMALGRDNRPSTLTIVSEDGGGSTMRYRVELGSVRETTPVSQVCLDDAGSFTKLGLIKIDAEGAESDVIAGAVYTIRKHRPFLLFEAWQHLWYAVERERLIKQVEDLDYKVESVRGWPEMLLATPRG